jgi:hypothetical protein
MIFSESSELSMIQYIQIFSPLSAYCSTWWTLSQARENLWWQTSWLAGARPAAGVAEDVCGTRATVLVTIGPVQYGETQNQITFYWKKKKKEKNRGCTAGSVL